MRAKIYLETTILSYLAARPSRDLLIAAHQQMTHQWWSARRNEFDLFVSELVLEECSMGDTVVAGRRLDLLQEIPILGADDRIAHLAGQILDGGAIPPKAAAAADAVHIATATVYGCEFLLTWNCRHIANAELQRKLRRITADHGHDLPLIRAPEELMGEDS